MTLSLLNYFWFIFQIQLLACQENADCELSAAWFWQTVQKHRSAAAVLSSSKELAGPGSQMDDGCTCFEISLEFATFDETVISSSPGGQWLPFKGSLSHSLHHTLFPSIRKNRIPAAVL